MSYKNCLACNSTGEVPCPVCRGGNKEVVCPDCSGLGLYHDGEKTRSCERCEGEGFVGPDSCGHCGGIYMIDCHPCAGSGEIDEEDCAKCGGSEEVPCSECNGSGEVLGETDVLVACNECDGTGNVACPACP